MATVSRAAEYAVRGDADDGRPRYTCLLCPNRCVISSGYRGRCQARGVDGDRFVLHNYGCVVAANLDPIEKKPLYHFYPGSGIFSVGSYGCNLFCRFCQNCDISQHIVAGETVTPQQLVDTALRQRHSIGVAFTYNEPTIGYEFLLDTAPLLHAQRQKVVLVTNGYLEPEPWQTLMTHVDAANIDLKGFTSEFYRDVCGGRLDAVLRNIEAALAAGVHVELTHLVVTDLNVDREAFSHLVDWVAQHDRAVPLHLSRYFPRHRHSAPPTDPEILREWYAIARRRLDHVYVGNLATDTGQDTVCPQCGTKWIHRHGYSVDVILKTDRCPCGRPIPVRGFVAGANTIA